ncbi:hypothetical protein XENOCAPTIV_014661 [Xenoophorus captivus]|uniref:STAS domain-containing protein n=1 Tax=Xenoophorus captivus TaxID=1517983 RepID=A0ABV0RA31_9TELE
MLPKDDSCAAVEDRAEGDPQHPLILERVEKKPEKKWHTVVLDRVKKHCSCTPEKVKSKILGFVPILKWLPHYKLRDWILGDLMSGIIVAILLVPQSIAYSLLASQDPIYGIYTSFFSSVIYAILGSSRHISVGIFGVLCLLVGQVVDRELALAGYLPESSIGINNSDTLLAGQGNGSNAECDRSCYAITVLMGLLQVGFVSVYLSDSLLSGFATGASLTILTSQIKYLLGLKIPRPQGWFTMFKTWYGVFTNLATTNICDLITSLVCLAVLIPAKELNELFKSKLKAPIPFELFVVIIATLASHFGHFSSEYGSGVAGDIPTGFLPPQLPAWKLIPNVAVDAFSIAIVGFAITVSLSEMFAKKHGYTVDANQEMYAIGFCNILPSFFRCFTTSAALTKTLVKESTGCQTQMIDASIWLITMATSALVNTELGLLVGVLTSAFFVLGRTQQAQVTELGCTATREHYENVSSYRGLQTHSGVAVFRYGAPIYYANQSLFKKSLYKCADLNPVKEKAMRLKFKKNKKQQEETGKIPKVKSEDNLSKENEVEASASITMMLDEKSSINIRSLVIDCSGILFLDTAGINALKEVRKDYRELGVEVVLAQCNTSVLDSLERGGYYDSKKDGEVGKNNMTFFTIADAVSYAQSINVPNGDYDNKS